MSRKSKDAAPPGVTLGDILYVIFRHKWKIALISAVGIVAALVLSLVRPAQFQSEAKLYVRYVLESKSPTQGDANDARIRSPDERGDSIMNTEMEILTSLDLAQQVADAVGPAKVLAKFGGRTDRYEAAGVIHGRLSAEVPKNSTVIRLVFQHPDPGLVQPVLNQLINSYFKKHGEIHAVGAFDEFLTQETDQLHSRLVQTEEELRKAKAKAGVISLEDSKRIYTEQIGRIRQAIFEAEAELAERRAGASEMAKLLHTKPAGPTNEVEASKQVTVPVEKTAEYKRVCTLLDSLGRKEQELLVQYTAESSLVREIQAQIAANEKRKLELETEDPGLVAVRATEIRVATAEPGSTSRTDLVTEMSRVTALESRIKVLTDQLDKIRTEATAMDEAEGSIEELNRKHGLEEVDYQAFQKSLKQSRLDEKLGAGKVSNISTIQEPSPPFPAASKLHKTMASIVFGSIAGAFTLAFLIEFYWDRSLKRPVEVETKLGLPLFLSIPLIDQNGKPKTLKADRMPLLPADTGKARRSGEEAPVADPQSPAKSEERESGVERQEASLSHGEVVFLDPRHRLRPFHEALRDRLITFFEVKGLTHKPKLVAVTSCASGSGVSTIAAGMAASLSETGDGNVLLVGMNAQNGAAHQFYRGAPACDLDDALEAEKRCSALIQENLYVVRESTNSDKLPRVLPKRFTHLVPRLKASDYDYIIFDMPPISQTSATPRLARFMDMVLIVVESEKTNYDLVKSGSALVVESDASVGIVLNKGRTYIPRRLQPEL